MRTRLWAAVGLALSLFAGSFAFAGPASAAVGDCASGHFCFWVDSNYNGARYNLGSGDLNGNLSGNACGGCRSSTNSGANGTWNDMASSWYNHTSIQYCIYWDSNYSGANLMFGANDHLTISSSWNDRMTSVKPAVRRKGSGTIPDQWVCN